MKYIITLMVLLTFSCKSQRQNPINDSRLVLVVQDGYFPVENPETHIIGDSKTLRAFYSKVNRTRKPGLPVPDIDFSKSKVLIACLGATNTNSLPVMYLKSETADEIIVSAQLPNKSGTSGIQAYPFCVYKIVNDGKKVAIEIN